jgi:phosphoribosyl 1,2-cyclic phosphate phosphodiesterase
MNLTFLGTAAANAVPEPFCHCTNCASARALGGPSFRKRSAALVDDVLLIDLGPDVLSAAALHARPFTRVEHCLQTHAHTDHLDVSHFLSRSPEFGVVGAPRLHWYASAPTAAWAAHLFHDCDTGDLLDPATGDRLNLSVHVVEAFQPFTAGPYRVTGVPASHHRGAGCLLYAIQGDGRTLFYGTDTGALDEAVWQVFHAQGLRFDLVVLDHTCGPDQADTNEHLSASGVAAHAARLRREGLLAPDGRVFATHIFHQGNPPHPDLAAFASRHGYDVAYDGLTVSV